MRRLMMALAGMALANPFYTAAAGPDSPRSHYGAWGVDLTTMDATLKPGDDFYTFCNGSWLNTAVIPADRSAVGVVFDLVIQAEQRITEIITKLNSSPYPKLNDEEKKIHDLYGSFIDRREIDARGLSPVQADLDGFTNLSSLKGVASAMGSPQLMTPSAIDLMHSGLFNLQIRIDALNPYAYAIYVSQSSLGMPDRDYYLRADKAFVATRTAYKKYLADILSLAGAANFVKRAAAVYKLEKKIADAQWANSEIRDKSKNYNPMAFDELETFAPGFYWKPYFAAAGLPIDGHRQVILVERSAFPKLTAIFSATPVKVWSDFLEVRYLHAHAAFLPAPFEDADFAFYGRVIQGSGKLLSRDTRGGQLINDLMGDALGKLYVSRYFPPTSKTKVEALVNNLRKAYDADIRELSWMTPETRQKALEKLHKLTVHIGYPEHWRDYSQLHIVSNDLIGNVHRAVYVEWQRQVGRLDQPVDRAEWSMTPQTVNAQNKASLNAIFFPAAVLQPPIFDPNADEAVNYGGMGAVIGHEISHSFDDQGSKFNGDGASEDWWTKKDRITFDEKSAALEKQFDSYAPLPGLYVNGEATMGENIADLAGLAIAVKAYHIDLGQKTADALDGFTGDQRLFLSYAQLWRVKFREGAVREQLLSDDHSPPQFRVNGATRNLDVWYSAFDVKPDDRYYLAPDVRVKLW